MIPIVGYNEDPDMFPTTSLRMLPADTPELRDRLRQLFNPREVVPIGRGFNNFHHLLHDCPGGHDLVVRRVLFPVPALAKRLRREYAVLEHLANLGYDYAPRPVRLLVSGEVDPSPSFAMEYVKGYQPGFSENAPRDLGIAVRALHRLPPPPFLNAGQQTAPGPILERMVAMLWRKLAVVEPDMHPADRRVAKRILRTAARQVECMDWDSRETSLLHGDLGDHNMLRERGTERLVLIDWEFAAVSHPALDIMWLFNREAFGPKEYDAFLEGYGEPFQDECRRRLLPLAALCAVEDAVWAQSGVTDIHRGENGHYFNPGDLSFLKRQVQRLHEVDLATSY